MSDSNLSFDPLRSQLQSLQLELNSPLDSSRPVAGTPSFSGVMQQAIQQIDSQQQSAEQKMNAVDLGQSHDLMGAMLASQKASLSFMALIQVRNKAVSAYNEVMQMPV
ncbi:flagellar hook-basal body complex protein FliE [Dongshaea marina]|uniref:flagellar hook-basal body complex protein FliE n=1 Tax=Dongshaea marina TaxID=2047966 RepID=UPI000D3E0ED6|nr:flagellar hook-basal body complex protein FliE [Dongshaea marina]